MTSGKTDGGSAEGREWGDGGRGDGISNGGEETKKSGKETKAERHTSERCEGGLSGCPAVGLSGRLAAACSLSVCLPVFSLSPSLSLSLSLSHTRPRPLHPPLCVPQGSGDDYPSMCMQESAEPRLIAGQETKDEADRPDKQINRQTEVNRQKKMRPPPCSCRSCPTASVHPSVRPLTRPLFPLVLALLAHHGLIIPLLTI